MAAVDSRQRKPVEDGRLLECSVESWKEPAYLSPEARVPACIQACALFNLFDPLIWDRRRTKRLFGAGWLGLERMEVCGGGYMVSELKQALT